MTQRYCCCCCCTERFQRYSSTSRRAIATLQPVIYGAFWCQLGLSEQYYFVTLHSAPRGMSCATRCQLLLMRLFCSVNEMACISQKTLPRVVCFAGTPRNVSSVRGAELRFQWSWWPPPRDHGIKIIILAEVEAYLRCDACGWSDQFFWMGNCFSVLKEARSGSDSIAAAAAEFETLVGLWNCLRTCCTWSVSVIGCAIWTTTQKITSSQLRKKTTKIIKKNYMWVEMREKPRSVSEGNWRCLDVTESPPCQ